MKIVKPKDLAGLFRFFQNQRRYYLCLSTLFFFPFAQPRALFSEQKLWPFAKARLGKGFALDEGMPKPRGEYLVCGSAFAPGGGETGQATVEVRMGPLSKLLTVFGDRTWTRSPDHFDRLVGNSWLIGPVQPFAEMPLTWDRAFGGPEFAANQAGKGHLPVGTEPVEGQSPLPNLEQPEQMMAGPWAEPRPAGLMPRDIGSPPRAAKAGTFDAAWLREMFPGLPADLDWGMYSMADDDQQNAGYWSGGEDFAIRGMHPDRQQVQGRLPGLRPRAFVKTRGGEDFDEVGLDLDTVWLFPREECGVLVYHGTREIASWDGRELSDLLLAYEYQDGLSRPLEDYRASLANRRRRGQAGLWSLRQDDLQPPEGTPRPPEAPRPQAPPPPQREKALKALERNDADLGRTLGQAGAKLEAVCKKFKLDPGPYLAKLKPPAAAASRVPESPPALRGLGDLSALMAFMSSEAPRMRREAAGLRSQAQAEMKSSQAELAKWRSLADEKLEAQAKKQGLDPKELMRRGREMDPDKEDVPGRMRAMARSMGKPERAPDTPEAKAEMERGRKALMEGAKKLEMAQAKAKKLEAAAAKVNPPRPAVGAHAMPPPELKSPPLRLADGQKALAVLAAGGSLAGADLTGADLTGADLAGADLKGVILESAILSRADLSGADLGRAVLSRAELDGAKLSGAKLVGANLGKARAQGADLSGCDLTRAVLDGADLGGAKLAGCLLGACQAHRTIFSRADLSSAKAAKAKFIQCDLKGAKLAGAELSGAMFYRTALDGADLSGAKAAKASFTKASAQKALFDGAELGGVRLALGADFSGASFKKAAAAGANWRGSGLEGADFSEAMLDGGDFGRCRLAEAVFYRASAKKTQFAGCDLSRASMRGINLMQGSLMEASLDHTDLTGSNLFNVNMINTRWNHAELEGANVKRTSLAGGRLS